MLTLDDEDYELLGFRATTQAEYARRAKETELSLQRLFAWKAKNPVRVRLMKRRQRKSRFRKRKKRVRTAAQKAALAAYMREYRKTEAGKKKTREATKKYRQSEAGRAKRVQWNKRYYEKAKSP